MWHGVKFSYVLDASPQEQEGNCYPATRFGVWGLGLGVSFCGCESGFFRDRFSCVGVVALGLLWTLLILSFTVFLIESSFAFLIESSASFFVFWSKESVAVIVELLGWGVSG